MEPETDQQRHAGEDKRQRDTARHWRGEEVKALLSVWRERQAWEEDESRAKYEAISSRLRELGVCRDWLDCKAQSRSMALPDWRPTQAVYKHSSADSRPPTQRPYVADEEPTAARREEPASLPALQEGNNNKINKATTFLDEAFELQLFLLSFFCWIFAVF